MLVQHTVRKADAAYIGARELANAAHGAAHSDKSLSLVALFAASASAAEWRLAEFNAQGLANTAWAFTKVKQSDEKLFTALARVSEQRFAEFNAQSLANTAWVFATVNQSDKKL